MDFEFLYPTCYYYLSNLFGCSILLSLALSFYVKGSSLFMETAVFDNNKENIFSVCLLINKLSMNHLVMVAILLPQRLPAKFQ